MASLVTLVMSDIVGSTRRWAADEVAMAADLEQHDRILGDAVGEAGGTLVKHTGDGMLAVFDDPVSAAGAGLPGSVGEITWAGTGGTYFWVDPKEQLAVVYLTQRPGPSRSQYRRLIRQLVYQAIAD